jgi:type IV secretory pathway VirB9-like protein
MTGRTFRLSHVAAALAALASAAFAGPAPTPSVAPQAAAPPPAISYAQTTAAQAKPAPATVTKPAESRAPETPHRRRHEHRGSQPSPQSVLHEAEVRSTETPKASELINATLHYAYEPGKLYTVETAVGYLTAIALRPGEHLVSKAAGDTVRWELGETTQGSASGPQVLLLIKPLDAAIRTNMILTTDQRTYVIDLVSSSGSDHATFVDWRYPAEELHDLQVQRAALTVQALTAQGAALPASPFITPPGAPARGVPSSPRLAGPTAFSPPAPVPAVAPAALDFNYRIEPQGRHAPGWTPEHVFDDGHKTYVKFPADISTMEIPPLFVIGPHGEAELVNYRFENGYYVVDRLFSAAELRLGAKDPQLVRILYKGGAR